VCVGVCVCVCVCVYVCVCAFVCGSVLACVDVWVLYKYVFDIGVCAVVCVMCFFMCVRLHTFIFLHTCIDPT